MTKVTYVLKSGESFVQKWRETPDQTVETLHTSFEAPDGEALQAADRAGRTILIPTHSIAFVAVEPEAQPDADG